MLLEEKVAIVTGASRGIGRAIALALAKEGCKVVVNFAGNQTSAEKVVGEVKDLGSEAIAIKADISNFEETQAMINQALDAFGKIDILVNNAGITRDNLLMRMKEEDWDQVINTNLKGAFNTTKAVIKPMMKARSGAIVNIASVVGVIGNAGQANYSAAKAGLIGFTKTIAREVASRSIRVNAVAPGYIVTDMTNQLDEKIKSALMEQIPLNRLGTPEEIADVVVFLASEKARYITGQTVNVNGGMAM